MTEAQFEGWFRQRIKALGGHTIKLAPIEAGTPDRLVMMPGGRMYLVELKTEIGKLSNIQVAWHTRSLHLGIPVYTLYGKAQALEWIRTITEEQYRTSIAASRAARRAGLTPVQD